jgi:hypothetical protein
MSKLERDRRVKSSVEANREPRMSATDSLLVYAGECMRAALVAKTAEERQVFIELARTWTEVATDRIPLPPEPTG